MDEKKIVIPGAVDPGPRPTPRTSTVTVESKGRVQLGASRDAGLRATIDEVAPDDVVRVEYSNGFHEWLRADDFYQRYASGGERGAAPTSAAVLYVDPRAAGLEERGVVGLAIDALEFFGVDLKQQAAVALCSAFEKKLLGSHGSRLRACTLDDQFALSDLTQPLAGGTGPLLVLIHGTGSNTAQSFGALWSDERSPSGRTVRGMLRQKFADRVYALEHPSLTASPVANALALAQALPDGAEVHLLTHSRGGLVGDLMCLGEREKTPDALTPDVLTALYAADKTIGEALGLGPRAAQADHDYATQRTELEQLVALLDRKQLRIKRFVRVASPSRGTTLASGRLDRWLSVLKFVADKSGVPLFDDGVDFLLGIVKERTDPRTLPGLEAMMPGSALTRLLNYPRVRVSADLTVIAGDVEGGSAWARIGTALTDWFYLDQHDLVVNTGSMYGGSPRTPPLARFALDRGPQVNHFNYFCNDKTVNLLKLALTSELEPAGFASLASAHHVAPAARAAILRSQASGPRPVLLVLPGTMGSQLRVDGDRVWLDYLDLAVGGLRRIGVTAGTVEPIDLLDDFYGEFLIHAARSHAIKPFAYDWRLSVLVIAERFALELQEQLTLCELSHQPLRIAAHSMGGLVVRAAFALHPELWQRFQALPGGRYVMFGTPNRGSHEAVRWLTGFNPTLQKLVLLDLTASTDAIIGLVNEFPGLLELLPSQDPAHDFTQPVLWQGLKQELGASWPLAGSANLARLAATWQTVASAPVDAERMIYVAGAVEQTVCDYKIVGDANRTPWSGQRAGKRLEFSFTPDGDGTVTWAAGRLAGVPTYYVPDLAHDALMGEDAPLEAYMDLIANGHTSRLSQTPPVRRARGARDEALRASSPPAPRMLPGPQEVATLGFGGGPTTSRAKRQRRQRLEVSIRHGDLRYARYPVVVGHYLGDSILSAEKSLDKRMNGALSQRLQLGLYPGPKGSTAIFLEPPGATDKAQSIIRGAVVIGLGQVGELGPGTLQSGMRQALLELALTVLQSADERFGEPGARRDVRICCLLIGSGLAGMEMRESLEAMLRGIDDANTQLTREALTDKVIIAGVEFLELFEDVAIAAARALQAIADTGVLSDRLNWSPRVIIESGNGRRRTEFDPRGDWWARVQILSDRDKDELRFTEFGKSARAEQNMIRGDLRNADAFIEEVCQTTARNVETSQTLFEMLLPNRLKDLAPEAHDCILLLDAYSARYPWELLEDRWGSRSEPPAIAAGMLRQFTTATFREQPRRAPGDTALVIGNPAIPLAHQDVFPALPGARAEAQGVAQTLGAAGLGVTLRVDSEAGDIYRALHGDAWRILHLAGHGVHEYAYTERDGADSRQRIVSGMVIGQQRYLTTSDVERLRFVPDIVFVNCCHLGRTVSSRGEATHYPQLAANLAVEFIRMGVRAVIAAGWAVDDRAAETFATTFYGSLIEGETFGNAVLRARQQTYRSYPSVNTWGAYQCYGDPDFRLRRDDITSRPARQSYVAAQELVIDLQNLTNDIRMGQAKDCAWHRQQREQYLGRIPDADRAAWCARADVAAALGEVEGNLGDYAEAARHLGIVMSARDANVSVRTIEHLANWTVRKAMDDWLDASARGADAQVTPATTKAIAAVELAITYLSALDQLGPTDERKSLLGGAKKRLARMRGSDRDARRAALVAMRDYYQAGYELGDQIGAPGYYPLTNWLTAEVVLSWATPPLQDRTDLTITTLVETWTRRARALAAAQLDANPDFWALTVAADCDLLLALVTDDGTAATHLEAALQGYRSAAQAGSSLSERNSVLEHLEFLLDMARAEDKTHHAEIVRRAKDDLIENWGKW